MQTLQAMTGFKEAELWIWHSTLAGGREDHAPFTYSSEPGDMSQTIQLKTLISDLADVRNGVAEWRDYCVIQFLCIPEEQREEIQTRFPRTRFIAGQGLQQQPPKPPGQPPVPHRGDQPARTPVKEEELSLIHI